jgi:hypothetical protein
VKNLETQLVVVWAQSGPMSMTAWRRVETRTKTKGGGQRGRPWGAFISRKQQRKLSRFDEPARCRAGQNEYEAVSSRIRGDRIADGSKNFGPDCIVAFVTMLLLIAL